MATVFTLSTDLLIPTDGEFDCVAGGIEGGRSINGDAIAIDFSGGGLVTAKYKRCNLITPVQHRYWSQLRALLNTRTRSILVPFITDWIAPAPVAPDFGGPLFATGIRHSDGTPFSDGAGYSQSTISASIAAAAAAGAGTLTLNVVSGGLLTGGEWFSIRHPTKNWRVYSIAEIDSSTPNVDGSTSYVVGLESPLREAVTAPTVAKFDRPLCLMRLAPGTTLPYAPMSANWWYFTPDISFIEAP